ncbi:hypothetical protein [Streptomyces antarcticus]|uniref:hypothetical protein n=1 Tax=Streptomyces antarcticus TaxID=2996458 RepID=UPI00226E3A0C|nr:MULTISPECIES: hypothetical protein [unclassified Streptomyces]MCY0945233.1 hypothetical protein [Streptomyces sp. H34-AA3]MCY0953560.1 hypothetical protein [Streptomyces sp. H27-S2]MCZ4083439.1 hypothetical protein [Streptomyces sp. H34-S5]
MRARHFAPLLLVCIALAGCGGDKEPLASDSPPPTAAEIAYYDCLKKEGVAVVYTDYGAPREDKSKPWNEAAHKACASLIPPPPPPVQAGPGELAAARKESACLRAEGITWYPDPNPVTGDVDGSGATAEQWATLKQLHIEALRKCRPDR